jgi:hypothetical protein
MQRCVETTSVRLAVTYYQPLNLWSHFYEILYSNFFFTKLVDQFRVPRQSAW